jgi:hypothetical protein
MLFPFAPERLCFFSSGRPPEVPEEGRSWLPRSSRICVIFELPDLPRSFRICVIFELPDLSRSLPMCDIFELPECFLSFSCRFLSRSSDLFAISFSFLAAIRAFCAATDGMPAPIRPVVPASVRVYLPLF